MTIIQLLILQFTAHLLADFIFQPQRWCDIKETKVFSRYLFYHTAIVFFTSYLLSFDWGFWKAALVLTLIHFVIDAFKSLTILRAPVKYLFFIDQFLHIITFTGIVIFYNYWCGIQFLVPMDTKVLAIVAGFVLCAKPTNIIIKFLLKAFSIETPTDDPFNEEGKSLPNAGKLIGITERFLALGLILLAQYEAVGLIIAAKSILRFNATQKSEYVLIGTLLSFGIATLAGICINLI